MIWVLIIPTTFDGDILLGVYDTAEKAMAATDGHEWSQDGDKWVGWVPAVASWVYSPPLVVKQVEINKRYVSEDGE